MAMFDFDTPITEDMSLYAAWDCSGGEPWDPDNPTLEGLKTALENGESVPIGTEIPDTYDGHSNPLIVAHQLTASNNSAYSGAVGVILIRKYVEGDRNYGNTADYRTSSMYQFLQTTYLEKCSDTLKSMISNITVPSYYGNNLYNVSGKWFIMSRDEIGVPYAGNYPNPTAGTRFDYWANHPITTPLTTSGQTPGNGWWTRTQDGYIYETLVGKVSYSMGGYVTSGNSNSGVGALYPACFIAAGGGVTPDEPAYTAPDLSQPLDETGYENLSKIVADGKASEYLNLGDEIKVPYGSYTMPFEIVGFEDVVVEGGGTVRAVNLLAKYVYKNTLYASNASTAYSASTLRTQMTNNLLNALDADFVACLGTTKVVTRTKSGSSDVVYDKLFAPSAAQIGIEVSNAYTQAQSDLEGPVYQKFIGATNADRISYRVDNTTSQNGYWTRSAAMDLNNNYMGVWSSGSGYSTSYLDKWYVRMACNFIGKQS